MSRCSYDGGDICIQNVRKPFQKLTFGIRRNTKKGKFKNIMSSGFVVGKRMELTQHWECGINGADILILSSQFIT